MSEIIEEVFRYGENQRGFGMLTLPMAMDKIAKTTPIVVLLNAGLLHRAEPYRLNLLASRKLAELGYICLRVDLSGKGDTPPRDDLSNRQSVATDWQFIEAALGKRLGERNIVILGLCSGADNAIKLTADHPSIQGLILLDPVSPDDGKFRQRTLINKLKNPHFLKNIPLKLWRRVRGIKPQKRQSAATPVVGTRDLPEASDVQACFQAIVKRRGAVLAVFTSHALRHYNQVGQFSRAIGTPGLSELCEEVLWPEVLHLYPTQSHRDRLLQLIENWAASHYEQLSSGSG